MADYMIFVECFAVFRGTVAKPQPTSQSLTYQRLVRFALESKEPHPDVWFGGRLPWTTGDPSAFVWCLGSDNLTAWIGHAHSHKMPSLDVPIPEFIYPTIDIAIMACIHRKPKFQRRDLTT